MQSLYSIRHSPQPANAADSLHSRLIFNVESVGKIIFRKFAINEMKYLESENSQNRPFSTGSLSSINYIN
jgi:hypothetical protein